MRSLALFFFFHTLYAPIFFLLRHAGKARAAEVENDLISQPNVKLVSYTRLDPIVNPGSIGNHTHAVVGGSAFGKSTTYNLATQSSCTTMPVQSDRSNYWLGPIYSVWENGSLSAIPILTTNITYLLRPPTNGVNVTEFPRDFQMLAGSATRNSSDPVAGKADFWIRFECHPTDGSEISQSYEFPDKQCSVLIASIQFPWCWNGKDLTPAGADGPTTNAHVAYGTGTKDDWVNCPSSHPIRLPRISYETAFDLTAFPYRGPNSSSFALSTGDTVGYSLHADFLNAWPQNYLNDVFDTRAACRAQQIGGTGDTNCSTTALKDFDAAAGRNCVQEGPEIPNEEVGLRSPIPGFPGCNTVFASDHIPGCNSAAYLSATQPNLTQADMYWGPDQIPLAATSQVVVVKKKSNVGAIVGGVLGGLALLASFLIFLLFRRKRQLRRQHQAQSRLLPPTQPQPKNGNHNPPSEGYELKPSWISSPTSTTAPSLAERKSSHGGGFVDASNSIVEHPSSNELQPSVDYSHSPSYSPDPSVGGVQNYTQRSTSASPPTSPLGSAFGGGGPGSPGGARSAADRRRISGWSDGGLREVTTVAGRPVG